MKWTYKDGDYRIIRRFLLFPRTIRKNGINETRWLCYVHIKQQYWIFFDGPKWEDVEFMD